MGPQWWSIIKRRKLSLVCIIILIFCELSDALSKSRTFDIKLANVAYRNLYETGMCRT